MLFCVVHNTSARWQWEIVCKRAFSATPVKQSNPTRKDSICFYMLHVDSFLFLKNSMQTFDKTRRVINEKCWRWCQKTKAAAKRLESRLLWWRWLRWLKFKCANADSPFLDVFTKSSLIDDALHELGLSDEYSLIGVVDCGDIMPVESWFVAVSLAVMFTPSWWWEFDKWGYQVGLRGGQHDSRIDWWRWLLFNKRSLS